MSEEKLRFLGSLLLEKGGESCVAVVTLLLVGMDKSDKLPKSCRGLGKRVVGCSRRKLRVGGTLSDGGGGHRTPLAPTVKQQFKRNSNLASKNQLFLMLRLDILDYLL